MDPVKVDLDNVTLVDLKQSRIDKDNSVIRHVAILSTLALNKNDEVFRRFTDEAMNDATQVFSGSLARIDHDKAVTEDPEGPGRGVRTGYGVYQNLTREGDKVFGDLHLWDCAEARKVMSIAERTPSAVGNSIHVAGLFSEDEKGVEVVHKLLPRTMQGLKPSVDLVEDPAATVSLYQDRREKTKGAKNIKNTKEKQMEWNELTVDKVRANRSDIFDLIMAEGFASRDEEVKGIEQERDKVSKELDETKVKQVQAERTALADQLLAESDLPDYAKTDVFCKQLRKVEESKEGDKTVSIEEGIKALIQDRIDSLDPAGVKDNSEKDVAQSTKAGNRGKVSQDEFRDTFGVSQNVVL